MNRKIKLMITAGVVLFGVGMVWWATTPSKAALDAKGGPRAMRQAMAKEGTPVAVAKVETGPMSVYLTGLGTVTPDNMVTVTSRVEGQLMKLYFTEGQMVEKGQLLAQIDARAFQATLTQAQGQLMKNQAALANARQDLARYQQLATQDSIPRQQLDAQISLVKQYQGAIQADQGSIASAKLQLEYSRITAPISGRVGLRKVNPGNIVKANDATGLVDIAQIAPINVLFSLPQSQLSTMLVRIQQDAEQPKVEVWDQGMKTQLGQGVVVTVDNQMDVSTGTIKIKASFDNKDFALFPNQFVNVRMYIEQLDNALMVPSEALQNGTAGDYVWVVDKDSNAVVRKVTKGFNDGTRTVITQGLNAGDTVITEGVERLKEGGKVAAVDPKQAQEDAATASKQKKAAKKP